MTVHHQLNSKMPADIETRAIEQQIAALGNSIGPGQRHRSQMLDVATESVDRSRTKIRSAQLAVALSIVLIVVSPLIGALTRVQAPVPQTAQQANSAALQQAEASRMTFDWALVDIFRQFRESKRGVGKPRS